METLQCWRVFIGSDESFHATCMLRCGATSRKLCALSISYSLLKLGVQGKNSLSAFCTVFIFGRTNSTAMSRKNSLVYNPGHTGNQTPTERSTSFCAECREKLLSWGAFERNAISFHRDIDELIGCGKQCELCNYICNLFGTHQLEDYLARAIEYNNKPAEPLGPDAANTIVYHNDGHRSLYLLSRDPKTTPTVDMRYDVRNSFLDSHGHLDHVTVQVIPCHHVTKRDDRRAFLLYTEAGTLPMSSFIKY